MINEINFFTSCCRELQPTFLNANPKEQNQIATFLKTWIFYNSASKNLFWTGKYTEQGLKDGVKEHWYPGLTVTKKLLETPEAFANNKELFFRVFSWMQWNYTSKQENQRLKSYQAPGVFDSSPINSDPTLSYQLANIELLENPSHQNVLPIIRDFFAQRLRKDGIVVQFNVNPTIAMSFLLVADELNLTEKILCLRGSKYLYYQGTLADLCKLVFTLFIHMINEQEYLQFLNDYNTPLNNAPIRSINNFNVEEHRTFIISTNEQSFPNFLEFFATTYRDGNYVYKWIDNMMDHLNLEWFVFNPNFERKA